MTLFAVISAIGGAINDAQKAIQKNSVDVFFEKFEGDEVLQAQTKTLRIPVGNDKYNIVTIPLAALCHHNNMHLEQIDVKLKVMLSFENDELQAELAPLKDNETCKGELTDISLTFKSDLPPEGLSRVIDSMNKTI